jgi:hypothetical protein
LIILATACFLSFGVLGSLQIASELLDVLPLIAFLPLRRSMAVWGIGLSTSPPGVLLFVVRRVGAPGSAFFGS